MSGLLVLGIAALWLWVAIRLGRLAAGACRARWKSSILGVLTFTAVAAMPFADEIAGRWQFQRLCASEAVLWVHPNAANVVKAQARPASRDLNGFIFPIREQVSEYVDATTREPFLRVTAFHTPGGFIMRAGLNMGSSASCWPERWSEPYTTLRLNELLKLGEQ